MDGQAERAARATRRDYCRACSAATLHPFFGWVTGDGWENTIRPRAYYRSCSGCGLVVMVLADATDAEGIARAVLDEHLRRHGGAATAKSAPVGPPPLDWELILMRLVAECWNLYSEKWNPSHGDGRVTFRSYATGTLRLRLDSIIREESGDASGRSKGRVHPKAHAPSVSTSLDAILEHCPERPGSAGSSKGTGMGFSPDDRDPVAEALGGRPGDLADDRSPDLAWALTARSRP